MYLLLILNVIGCNFEYNQNYFKMKNVKMFLVLILLCVTGVSIGQSNDGILSFKFRFGVIAGTSYYLLDKDDRASITQNDLERYLINVKDADLGIHFGIMTQFQINNLLLRPELVFNSNSISYQVVDLQNSSANTIAKEKYQNLDIPIMLGYDLGGLRVMAGPVGHVFITNKSELTKIENFTQDFSSLSLGYQAGLGIDIGNFWIDFRYEGNLTKLGKGIRFSEKEFYFSQTPSRLILSLTFAIK